MTDTGGGAPDAAGGQDAGQAIDPGGDGDRRLAELLSAGQVRAGRVTAADQLLSGIKVEGRVGDFKIYNDKVAFIIADARPTDGYAPFGGELLDAQRIGGNSLLGEVILGFGTVVLKPETVGVVNDGSDGKAALVRAVGRLANFPVLSGLLPGIGKGLPLLAVFDYVLEPDSEAIEVRMRLLNEGETTVPVPLGVAALLAGDGAEFFADGVGFEIGEAVPSSPVLGIVADEVAYSVWGVDGKLTPLIMTDGLWILSRDTMTLAPGEEGDLLLQIGVGAGTPEGYRALSRRMRGSAAPPRIEGRVLDPTKAAVAEAAVHVVEASGEQRYVTGTRTAADGKYSVAVAAGEYKVVVVAPGRAVVEKTLTVAGAATVDLEVGPTATLSFEVVDGQAQELPAKIHVEPKSPPPALPRAFGGVRLPGDAAAVRFHPGGSGTIALTPGEYQVTVSRGFEYEIVSEPLTLAAGQTVQRTFKLTRSVDTSGYMCGDFHLHAMRSPDSSDLYRLKVAALAAAGVELPVTTEHEFIADYNPTIAALGLQKWMRGIIGEELTTFTYGHFNPFPLTPSPDKPNAGALRWFDRTPPQLFADVRTAFEGAVFQVNHPRGRAISSYFSSAGYDPATGKASSPELWSTNFDAIEVFNDSGWADNREETVRDWFSLLDRGLKVTATGNSDSHDAYNSEVGYPRNYVKLSTDTPANVDLAELAAAIKGQRVVVSGGAFIEASVGETSLGQVAAAPSGSAALTIRVQAPTWVDLDTLEVIIGGVDKGKVVHTIKLDASTASASNPAVRYEGELTVSSTSDTWVIVVVSGSGSLAPVVRGERPFAVTNPIYLDVDGNGKYDAPLTFD